MCFGVIAAKIQQSIAVADDFLPVVLVNSIIQQCTPEDLAFIESKNDAYSCFGNYGTISSVSGGVYYGGHNLYGRGWWYADGTAYNQDNFGAENRSWVDYSAFAFMSDKIFSPSLHSLDKLLCNGYS